jgi:hypothetical protein
MRNDRTLYIDHKPRLGERIEDDAFECSESFWRECTMLWPWNDESLWDDASASLLANMLSFRMDAVGRKAHAVFDDKDGSQTREFIAFLRGGGFSVVELQS